MRLRWLLGTILIHLQLSNGLSAAEIRNRREISSPLEAKSYKPPLIADAPPSQVVHYQPPLLLTSSNDYKPLISSSQTQSVRYQAPANAQGIPTGYTYSQSHGYGAPLLASAQTNSGSLNALPSQPGNRQGFSYSGDPIPSNQFQSQPLQQAGSKLESGTVSKDGDPKNDEYIVYYYYYYDNDNTTGSGGNKTNNSLNFDDIPSLESYDTDKNSKEPEKSASARTLAANVNSLNSQDGKRLSNQDDPIVSQPRSLSGLANQQHSFIRSDVRANFNNDESSDVQSLKPVSNVYRYGANEVPRLPVLPNFVVSDPTPDTRPGDSGPTPNALHHPSDNPTTQPSNHSPGSQLPGAPDHESDDINVVLDQPIESKLDDDKDKIAIEDSTTTTTTTEAPTTTEDPTTTTTEKSRRRGGSGNRRRFNPSPPASFSSSRRQGPSRSSSSTTSTTTSSPGSSSTRSSFRGSNRVRPRPTIANNRPRQSFSRNAASTSDNDDSTKPSDFSTSTTTARPKFGSSASGGRRFSSTRTRAQPGATTRNSSTASSPVNRSAITSVPRTRPSARPRPSNLASRSRGPRPGFLRPRPGSEPEEVETTTTAPQRSDDESSSAASSVSANESSPADEERDTDEDSSEDEETSETETEEPTTTEKSRFSALFRPRNRNTLNRPRPIVGDRSRRS